MNSVVLSVIMSVYNTKEEWLRESIESILQQSFRDFEFIIITDCPTDNSEIIVKEYERKDSRIKAVYNKENIGLTKNLNSAINMCQGKYIARMDSDDIALCNRFEEQIAFLDKNEEIAILGSAAIAFDESGKSWRITSSLTNNDDINAIRFLFYNAGIVHPTAMIRKSFLVDNGLNYNLNMRKSQDYGLWVEASIKHGSIRELEKPLLRYRVHSCQITKMNSVEQRRALLYAMGIQLERLEFQVNDDLLDLHYSLYNFDAQYSYKDYDQYITILLESNNCTKIYDSDLFKREILKIWRHDVIKAISKLKRISFIKSKWFITSLCNF